MLPTPLHDAPPFSAEARSRHRDALAGTTFDLLVVGGGITGAGIARDAACRGLSVALVDAGDFGRGTSSRSSRLIHGGLRYLETFDFGLVFEALAERSRLFRLAPHLVHPLPFLFPIFRGDEVGPLRLRAGMWLYDALALFRNISLHRMLGRGAALDREPALRPAGLRSAALYFDAQVDDARLTLSVARAAHEAGARTVPHAEVVGFLRDAGGRIAGARVRDALLGGESEVRARLVVCAAGPWTDEVRALADPDAYPRLRPTKGVHLMLRRERVGNRGAIIFRSTVDRRIMFVLPWGEFTYVGTTDTDVPRAADEPTVTPEDVAYLLDSVNALFPDARLTREDVLSTWAGIRPLLSPERGDGVSASSTSREHDIWRDPSGLLCIGGGKLTTFRVMAAEAVDEAARILEREAGVESGDCYTDELPLPGAPPAGWDELARRVGERSAALGIGAASAERLARAYGEEATELLDRIGADPSLGEPILPPHPYLWAEVGHAVRREMAVTLEDMLQRRLHLLYEAPDGGLEAAERVARRMAAEPGIGWDDETVAAQVASYRETVAVTRARG